MIASPSRNIKCHPYPVARAVDLVLPLGDFGWCHVQHLIAVPWMSSKDPMLRIKSHDVGCGTNAGLRQVSRRIRVHTHTQHTTKEACTPRRTPIPCYYSASYTFNSSCHPVETCCLRCSRPRAASRWQPTSFGATSFGDSFGYRGPQLIPGDVCTAFTVLADTSTQKDADETSSLGPPRVGALYEKRFVVCGVFRCDPARRRRSALKGVSTRACWSSMA